MSARGAYLLRREEENDSSYDVLCFNANPCDVSGVAADITIYYVPAEMEILGWYVQVEAEIHASVTPPVVSIDVADYDFTTNRTEVANLSIADHTAAGTEFPLPLTLPGIAQAGQTLILEHKTQAADGAAAAGIVHVQALVRWTGRG